jgi:hypothetical protein
MPAQRGGGLQVGRLDLGQERLQRGDQRQHERSARGQLGLADPSLRCAAKLGEQLRWLLASSVVLAR